MSRLVLITGANRGIGLAVVRELAARGDVAVLTARDGEAAVRAASEVNGPVLSHQLDVTDRGSIDRLSRWLSAEYGHLDALVNNAGVLYDTWERAGDVDFATVRRAFETNTIGAWQTTLGLLPLLQRGEHARIVNVSSEAGSLAHMNGGAPAYRVSKAALNAVTRMLASELAREQILVNAVCPGWIASDMGGPGGAPLAQGAASVLWAVDLPDSGPTGGFFRHGRPLPW